MATTFQQCGDQKKGVSEQWLVQKPDLTEFKKKKMRRHIGNSKHRQLFKRVLLQKNRNRAAAGKKTVKSRGCYLLLLL